jgi:hypothetical protein
MCHHPALTVSDRDLVQDTLQNFICADFLLVDPPPANAAHSFHEFESRDCAAVNAQFEASPSPQQAPCCNVPRLRLASLTLKVQVGLEGSLNESPPIATLLKPSVVDDAVARYIQYTLETEGGGLAQVVIRRDTHFAGIVYGAEPVNSRWLPGKVAPSVRYWSRRYLSANDPNARGVQALLTLAILFFVLSTLHEVIDLVASTLSLGELAVRLLSPYAICFWWVSIVLPWCMTALQAVIPLSQFSIAVTGVELAMFVRLWVEGEALSPFRTIVLTLVAAARQLLTFCVAMFLTITVSSPVTPVALP